MKILWVKSDYLHPTTRGGQIRTLEMLRCLHRRHEIHYVCLDDGTQQPEGPARCHEYCTFAYSTEHKVPPRRSLHFAGQLLKGIVSSLPVSAFRYQSAGMREQIKSLLAQHQFDSVVCDFLFPALNVPDISQAVLFQHNVEAAIWDRHVEQAPHALARFYLRQQARKMEAYERRVCRQAGFVVAVSEKDRETMRSRYGVERISAISTGVDLDYFSPPATVEHKADLVFVGSMDWLPNIDGVRFLAEQILPRIRARRPDCRVAIVGRRPDAAVRELGARDPNVIVTGTVADVRPWLWGSAVSIVPLRIGGGTRLKIFEAMAARVPVISTTIGAEGLPVENDRHLFIADDAESFANACLHLLENQQRRHQMADEAWNLVSGQFSWDAVTREFETILENYHAHSASIR